MKIRPYFLDSAMIHAALCGKKETIRQPVRAGLRVGDKSVRAVPDAFNDGFSRVEILNEQGEKVRDVRPPCAPRSLLYIPEPWRLHGGGSGAEYAVEFQDGAVIPFHFESEERASAWSKYLDAQHQKWQSPYRMPREAARLIMLVERIRVENLLSITEAGARAEGFFPGWKLAEESPGAATARQAFLWHWDAMIKPRDCFRESSRFDPLVWVIEVKRVNREAAGLGN